tara:strand:+ start:2072 stop:2416 length:345 start_codon:yes stop_codon:yes gene_type:complete
MKITIWIHKSEAISGNITKYHTHGLPQTSNWPDYVQVQISQDEFARLEDNNVEYVSEEEMDKLEAKYGSEEIPMIHERNPDTGDVRSRPASWYVDQYNRNRDPKDHITHKSQIK